MAMELMLQQMPPNMFSQLCKVVRNYQGKGFSAPGAIPASRTIVRVATLCSGTDVGMEALRIWLSLFDDELGTAMNGFQMSYEFACEISETKQTFIMTFGNSRPRLLFADVRHLHLDATVDLLTGAMVPIPTVDLVLGGFECDSVSALNVHASKHRACILTGTGATGETFHGCLRYIERHRPCTAILENVKMLGASSVANTANTTERSGDGPIRKKKRIDNAGDAGHNAKNANLDQCVGHSVTHFLLASLQLHGCFTLPSPRQVRCGPHHMEPCAHTPPHSGPRIHTLLDHWTRSGALDPAARLPRGRQDYGPLGAWLRAAPWPHLLLVRAA